jgi:integrase
MPRAELTDKFCRAAKSASGRKTDYFDTIVKGLVLRASSTGAKSWYAVYGQPAKRRWLKLGTYPELPLGGENGARQRARDTRAKVSHGADPVADRKAHAASMTVADLVDNYLSRKARNLRSSNELERKLRKEVVPLIGNVKLAELHKRDVTKVIDAALDRGSPISANRLFAAIRGMLNWGLSRGDLDHNVIAGMEKPAEEKSRERFLLSHEIVTMWRALDETAMWESTARALRLCLVTGQRVGEITGMTTKEIDLEQAVWTIPATRAKNGLQHVVPLSPMAIRIIRRQLDHVAALAKRAGREVPTFVFPAPGARSSLDNRAIAHALRRARDEKGKVLGLTQWTAHDLRRTAATHMEELGISPFVIGHVLNHVSATRASITTRVYARYTYDREKREALNLWADRLNGIIGSGANIIALRDIGA